MHKRTVIAALLAAGLALSGPAVPAATAGGPRPATPVPDLATLLAWMTGDFDNRAQFEAQPPAAEPRFLLLGIQRRLVQVPALGTHIVYAQVNDAADPARIRRQRLFAFAPDAGGGIVMTSWSFVDEDAARDILGRLGDLAAMPATAFRPSLPAGCDMRWTATEGTWSGRVDPGTCTISARRDGAPMKLRSTEILDAAGLRNEEAGFTAAGVMAFGLPDGVYYEFRRIR